MANQKDYREGYSGKGSWKETLTGGEPEGGQRSERLAGFRADDMHKSDGSNKE